MLRSSVRASITILLFAALSASAAIFPDQVGEFKKGTPKTIGIPDQALYDEFGLDATESAEYIAAGKKLLTVGRVENLRCSKTWPIIRYALAALEEF
jgi:hypothetical protein